MKRLICLFTTLVLLVMQLGALTVSATVTKEDGSIIWKFDQQDMIDTFFAGGPNNLKSSEIVDGVWKTTPSDVLTIHDVAFLAEQDYVSLDEYPYLAIKYKLTDCDYFDFYIFFQTTSHNLDGAEKCTLATESDGEWHTGVWDMRKEEGGSFWKDQLTIFRLDGFFALYEEGNNDALFVDYIAFFKTAEEAEAYTGEKVQEGSGSSSDSADDYVKTVEDGNGIIWSMTAPYMSDVFFAGSPYNGTSRFKDGVLHLTPFDTVGTLDVAFLDEAHQIPCEEYPYFVVKYKANTDYVDLWFLFSTDTHELDGSERTTVTMDSQDIWEYAVVDMRLGEGGGFWKGTMTIARFDFNFALYEKGGDDSLDIEYYGFFKTKEAVESYIGKTVNLDPPAGPTDGTEPQPDDTDSETVKDTDPSTTTFPSDNNASTPTTVGGDDTPVGGDVTTGADAPSDLSVIGIEGILLIVAGVLVVVAVVVYFVIYKKKK